jgi:hypothetical protein
MFQGQPNGGTFKVFGVYYFFSHLGEFDHMLFIAFEYYANPSSPDEGYITWYSDGKPSYRMGAASMGPDTGDGGTGVGQRLIPEEPMVSFDPGPFLLYTTPY